MRLKSYDVLDTLPEQEFDDLVRIAAEICDTPIALISLVDDRRQWFKARLGLEAGETPRAVAFCHHAIQRPEEVMVVEDATRDDRFENNPLVTGHPDIRFYAGAPLTTRDGHCLGTICVIDTEARRLEQDARLALEALGRRFPGRRIVSVFEPRSGTLRRNVFQHELPQALRHADRVYIASVFRPEAIAAEDRLDTERVVADLAAFDVQASFLPSADAIVDELLVETRPGDVIAIMSNGGFDGLHGKLMAGLSARAGVTGGD